MKKSILLIILFILPQFALAQSVAKIPTEIMLQNIANDLKKLDEKVDKKFEQMDARFDKIEQRLGEIDKKIAGYDERFISLSSRFTIFASIAGFVIIISMSIFAFLFNKLYNLDRSGRSSVPQFTLPPELFEKEIKFLKQEIKEIKSKMKIMDN